MRRDRLRDPSLARASVEQLAAVQGIGIELAKAILERLRAKQD